MIVVDAKKLKKVVLAYIQGKSEYALMIDSPWGSGKTSFIKKIIEEFEAKPKKIAYFSLNGLTGREQVLDSIVTSVIGLDGFSEEASEKTSGVLGKIIGSFADDKNLGGAVGTVLSVVASTIKSKVLEGLGSQHTIIADDLERFLGEKESALAVLNDLSEHQNVKIILLCHSGESGVPEEKFTVIKEKLVKYSYSLEYTGQERLEMVLDTIDGKLRPANIKKEIVDVIETLEITNLRTLIFAAHCYSIIANIVFNYEKVERKHHARVEHYFIACLIFAVASRDKGIGKGDVERSLGAYKWIAKEKEETSAALEFAGQLTKMRFVFNLFDTAKQMVYEGFFDEESLEREVKENILPDECLGTLFFSPHLLSNEEFELAMGKAIDLMKDKTLGAVSTEDVFSKAMCFYNYINDGAYSYDLDVYKRIVEGWVSKILAKDENLNLVVLSNDSALSGFRKWVRDLIEEKRAKVVEVRFRLDHENALRGIFNPETYSSSELQSYAGLLEYNIVKSNFIGIVKSLVEARCVENNVRLNRFFSRRYTVASLAIISGAERIAILALCREMTISCRGEISHSAYYLRIVKNTFITAYRGYRSERSRNNN